MVDSVKPLFQVNFFLLFLTYQEHKKSFLWFAQKNIIILDKVITKIMSDIPKIKNKQLLQIVNFYLIAHFQLRHILL